MQTLTSALYLINLNSHLQTAGWIYLPIYSNKTQTSVYLCQDRTDLPSKCIPHSKIFVNVYCIC